MRVGNGLSSRVADVDADIVAVGYTVGFDVPPHFGNERPNCPLLLDGKGEEIRLVAPWDNQTVARIEWIAVKEGGRKVVLDNDVSA